MFNASDVQAASGDTSHALEARLRYCEKRLVEAFERLWSSFVDPSDALWDDDGARWRRIGEGAAGSAPAVPFADEHQLAEIRGECRILAATNEFAINGHENRISYIVGSGHGYRVAARGGDPAAQPLARQAQAVLDEFIRRVRWHHRQQEIVRRKDRDGECFLRLFAQEDGRTEVRFVEPEQVSTPRARAGDPTASFGILTDPEDVETVLAYYIDGRAVPAAEIQHRKANVDCNVKRGLPLFYPVRKNLRRAEKLLRNMSVVAEIQSAIALIRKHAVAGRAELDRFLHDQSDAALRDPATGRRHYFHRFAPGTIIDAAGGTEYQFPAANLDASRYVAVLQAELRAIASRLVMPEFMLTSDASNANYASTMVAEGPAVKMFDRLQREMTAEDLEVMWRVLAHAVVGGLLPADTLTEIEVRAIAPTLAVRDRLRDAQADQILVRAGAMSVATMALRHGLDPEHERQWIALAGSVQTLADNAQVLAGDTQTIGESGPKNALAGGFPL
jgi:capsid protein